MVIGSSKSPLTPETPCGLLASGGQHEGSHQRSQWVFRLFSPGALAPGLFAWIATAAAIAGAMNPTEGLCGVLLF